MEARIFLDKQQDSTQHTNTATLATTAYLSPQKMCAMHLLSVFMEAVAQKIEPIRGRTTLESKGPSTSGNGYIVKLTNTMLTQLAQGVSQTDLCSREEAHLTIVSALSIAGKLPKVDAIVKLVTTPNVMRDHVKLEFKRY